MGETARRRPARTVACFPPTLEANPYLALLQAALGREGIRQSTLPDLSLRRLWAARRRVRALHLNWQESLYRFERGPRRLRAPLSWVKLARLVLRLAAARLLGYRVVWTIHQVLPHERPHRGLDRVAGIWLARLAGALVVHDTDTGVEARRLLRAPERKLSVVPHGSYVGVYPPGAPRHEVRRRLSLAADDVVLLSFGELRAYKGIGLLLEAFTGVRRPDLALVIAGNPKDDAVAGAVRAAAARDRRIRTVLEFVPDSGVAELYGASDVAVLTRSGGTSGSLVLALSLGVPVIAPDVRSYRELVGDDAGWLYRRLDPVALRQAILAAVADPAESRRRGRRALERAQALRWETTAALLAPLLAGEATP